MSYQEFDADGEQRFIISKLIEEVSVQNNEISESSGEITCVSSFEDNVYIGTSLGEILHYYCLNNEFLLISRQRGQTSIKKGTKPVKKILLLPQVSKALVLCGSVVNVFTLPELSPDNLGKIKDVSDLSVDVDSFYHFDGEDSKQKAEELEIPVVLFTKKNIRLISVTSKTLKLVKDIVYTNTVEGLRRSKFCLVATQRHYDLINIDSSQKIPLLPVSNVDFEDSNDIGLPNPHITLILKSEYLVTCGSGKGDPSMGMILNENGDASRGTLTWNKYPDSLQTLYPYILSVTQNELHVHSLATQGIIQKLDLPNSDKKLTMATKIFSKRLTNENKDFISATNILMFDKNSIDLVFQIPYDHTVRTTLTEVREKVILENQNKSTFTFLETIVGLIIRQYRALLGYFLEKYADQNYLNIMLDLQNIDYSGGSITLEDKQLFNDVRQYFYISLLFSHNTERCVDFWRKDNEIKTVLEQNLYDEIKVLRLLLKINEHDPEQMKNIDMLDQKIKWLLIQPSPEILLQFLNSNIRTKKLKQSKQEMEHGSLKIIAEDLKSSDLELTVQILDEHIDLEKIKIIVEILTNFLDDVCEVLMESAGVNFNSKTANPHVVDNKQPGVQKSGKRARSKTISESNALSHSIYGNRQASQSDSRLSVDQSFKPLRKIIKSANKLIMISTFDIDESFTSLPIGVISMYCKVANVLLNYFISLNNEEELLNFICEKLKLISSLPSNYESINNFLTVESVYDALKTSGFFSIALALLKVLNRFSDYLELWMEHSSECQVLTFLTVHRYIISTLSEENSFEIKEKKLMIMKYLNYLVEQKVLLWALKLLFSSELSRLFETHDIMAFLETLKSNDIKSEDIKNATDGMFQNILELKIHYLEILSEGSVNDITKDSGIGLLLEYHVSYLKELFSTSSSISNYLSDYLIEYKNLNKNPKLSILEFIKIKMKSADKDKKLLIKGFNTTMKLFNILDEISTIKPDIRIEYKYKLLNIKEILGSVSDEFTDQGFSFSIIRLFIDACQGNMSKTVDQLLAFTDFSTAETYIVSQGSRLFEQTIIVPQGSVCRNEQMMHAQLLKLLKHYLHTYPENETLLKTFLSKYWKYFDAYTLISTISDSNAYSLKFINDSILMKQMVRVEELYQESLIKKQLARSNVIYYDKILKQLRKK